VFRQHGALRYCDVAVPAPAPHHGTADDEAKIEEIFLQLAQMHALIPNLPKIHEIDPRLPDDEFYLFDHSFMSALGLIRARLPSYWNWVMESGDLNGLYRELKHFVAYVGKHRTGSRWVLKTPQHLLMFSHLLGGFPRACVIWTDRDPAKCVPSMASLSRAIRLAGSDAVNNEGSGRYWMELLADGVSRAMEYRDGTGEKRIHYHDLVRDPQRTVARIYEAFGVDLSESMPKAIARHLAENPKGKHGLHRYSAEEFGLSNEEIRERFSAYIEEYKVQCEGA
jgi:hypothetical protein